MDRSTAQQLGSNCGQYRPLSQTLRKRPSSSTSSSTVTSSAGSEQQNQSSSWVREHRQGFLLFLHKGRHVSSKWWIFLKLHTWNCENYESGYEIHILHLPMPLAPWKIFCGHLTSSDAARIISACHGHLATKEFLAPWRITSLTLLCIPLFYMIFLTIIYNWMCSWIYFYKKNLLCTIFHVHYNWFFVFVLLGEAGWEGEGALFIVFTDSILSAYPFKFSSSSSYTMYYQFLI